MLVSIKKDNISRYEEAHLFSLAVRACYHRSQKGVPRLDSRRYLFFCDEIRQYSKAVSSFVVLHFLAAAKLSGIHHLYSKRGISSLTIADPICISSMTHGTIGKFCNVPVIFLRDRSLVKMPPLFINSAHEVPLIITPPASGAPPSTKNVEVLEPTKIANIKKILDIEAKVAMDYSKNPDSYRIFMQDLSKAIAKEYHEQEKQYGLRTTRDQLIHGPIGPD